MTLPLTTIEGNLGADPELRFLQSGVAVANFRVGMTERKFNRDSNQWEDGRTLWVSVAAWREVAENVTESLHRGDRVIVVGHLYEESYTTDQGVERTALKMDARNVGPSLQSATARIQRTQRQGGNSQQQNGGQQGQQGQQGQAPGWGGQQQQDPWATPAQGQQPPAQAPPSGGQAPGWGPPAGAPAGQQQGGWGQAPSYGEPPF